MLEISPFPVVIWMTSRKEPDISVQCNFWKTELGSSQVCEHSAQEWQCGHCLRTLGGLSKKGRMEVY